MASVKKCKKISYDAKVSCKDLSSFLDEEVEVKVTKSNEEMNKVTNELIWSAKTDFEKYWGCGPDQIVLTKQEEKK